MQPIFKYNDGSYVAFTKGAFDCWKVAYYDKEGKLERPRLDTDTFKWLIQHRNNLIGVLTKEKATQRVWEEVLNVARPINKDMTVVQLQKHIEDNKLDRQWAMLAMMMYAEEMKAHAILGKLIKLLGIYQIFFKGYPLHKAASWSKGRPWKEILEKIDDYKIREALGEYVDR